MSLLTVQAVILFDLDGSRLLSKFYGGLAAPGREAEQKKLEGTIYDKIRRAPTGEILIVGDHLVLYKNAADLLVCVVSHISDNEIYGAQILNNLVDAWGIVLHASLEKAIVLENLDLIMLTLDEMIDEGIVLDHDTSSVASRVSRLRPTASVDGLAALAEMPINEQSLTAALLQARDQVVRSLLN